MRLLRRFTLLCAAAAAVSLTGCGMFFPPPGTTNPTTACTDCFFVTLNDGTRGLAGYSISTAGVLTQAGSTISLSGLGTSLAISPVAPFLYVGSTAGESILAYQINTDGSLTAAANGQSIVTALTPTAMAVDPSGNYLVVVSQGTLCSNNNAQTCFLLSVVPISSSTGAASGSTIASVTLPVTGQNLGNSCSTVAACNQIAFSSTGAIAYFALGNGGLAAFSFSSGVLSQNPLSTMVAGSSTTSVNSVVVTSAGVFAGASGVGGGLYAFTPSSTGGTAFAHAPFTTGDTTTHSEWAVAASASGYVYVTNASAGTITGYAVSSLTAATNSTPAVLSGSPYTASTATGIYNTTGLVIDNTGDFVLAMSTGGDYDVSLFTIGTGGALGTATTQLNLGGTTTSGSPQAIAATASGT